MKRRILFGVLLAGSTSSHASAALITQSEAFSVNFTSGTGVLRSFSLSFDKFDSAIGTLNSVSFDLDSTISTAGFFVDTSAVNPGPYHVSVQLPYTFAVLAPSANNSGTASQSSGCSRAYTNASNRQCSDTGPAMNADADLTHLASSLGAYTGGPGDDVLAGLRLERGLPIILSSLNIPGFGYSTNPGSWEGNLTLVYDYTPALLAVPEPSTAALLLMAALALDSRVRRRAVNSMRCAQAADRSDWS